MVDGKAGSWGSTPPDHLTVMILNMRSSSQTKRSQYRTTQSGKRLNLT